MSHQDVSAYPHDRTHDIVEAETVVVDFAWYGALFLLGVAALIKTAHFVLGEVDLAEIGHVVLYGLITLLRVAVLIVLASVI